MCVVVVSSEIKVVVDCVATDVVGMLVFVDDNVVVDDDNDLVVMGFVVVDVDDDNDDLVVVGFVVVDDDDVDNDLVVVGFVVDDDVVDVVMGRGVVDVGKEDIS